MRHVVSVSLGSSKRDKSVKVTIAGECFLVERIGTDGDIKKLARIMMELDGAVDAICLGGMDIYLYCGNKRYAFTQALMLSRIPKRTPVVDGSGWKRYVEPFAVRWLQENGVIHFNGLKTLIVSSVDRAFLARALYEAGCDLVFGDLAFCIGVNLPVRSWQLYLILSNIIVPLVTKLPITLVYPVGERQEKITPRYGNLYAWAQLIAGDFHLIRRYMPNDISGKMILTNTTTQQDIQDLRSRGARLLITTTPEFDGRTFGTNVMDGVVVALTGKHPDELTRSDYIEALRLMRWKPNIVMLTSDPH